MHRKLPLGVRKSTIDKRRHIYGRSIADLTYFMSSVVAQPKILNTALSVTWFNMEMSDLVIDFALTN